MTTLREAAQQALEALVLMRGKYEEYACAACDSADSAITALRAALAEPVQEPVGVLRTLVQIHPDGTETWREDPVWIVPPQRKPLTDEEIRRIKPVSPDLVDFRSGVRCAEWAHGIGGNK